MKQVILIPMWLKMSPGKVASQCAHVAAQAFELDNLFTSNPPIEARIILKVPTAEQMLNIVAQARTYRSRVCLNIFVDRAPTTEGTADKVTAVALTGQPCYVDPLTEGLELY